MVEIIDIQEKMEKKIVLGNNEIFDFANLGSNRRKSFEKLHRLSMYVKEGGKILYWLKRIKDSFDNISKSIEATRIDLVEKFCIKGEDGKPITIPIFLPEQKEKYDSELKKIENPSIDQIKELESKYCHRQPNGQPLVNYKIDDIDGLNTEFGSLLSEKNILPFLKIVINIEMLDRLNSPYKKHLSDGTMVEVSEPLSIEDMNNLEDIIDFTE